MSQQEMEITVMINFIILRVYTYFIEPKALVQSRLSFFSGMKFQFYPDALFSFHMCLSVQDFPVANNKIIPLTLSTTIDTKYYKSIIPKINSKC